ncbi:MAG: hypothetical protein JNL90_05275 [Planctomycetes bacterium]|nr:hypothetical protein [Planctomycetota bacterium]
MSSILAFVIPPAALTPAAELASDGIPNVTASGSHTVTMQSYPFAEKRLEIWVEVSFAIEEASVVLIDEDGKRHDLTSSWPIFGSWWWYGDGNKGIWYDPWGLSGGLPRAGTYTIEISDRYTGAPIGVGTCIIVGF